MKTLTNLWNEEYFIYLMRMSHLNRYPEKIKLFKNLHNIKFTYLLDRDENREADGIDLRNDFEIPQKYNVEIDEAFYAHWCSVLEMLIGLGIRVDNEYIGDPSEPHPEEFIMEMLENLELDDYYNFVFESANYASEEAKVRKIVKRWLDRRFDCCGNMSPFPVNSDKRDQRELEIWDQMNSYVYENYT